jgi:pimeloyl-ACP methyl ester carboxylesterase
MSTRSPVDPGPRHAAPGAYLAATEAGRHRASVPSSPHRAFVVVSCAVVAPIVARALLHVGNIAPRPMSCRVELSRPVMTTRTLHTPDVDLVYDVHGPLPTADGRPPLVMIAQPMDASGFRALVSRFADRTAVTYDPRGLGRSVRKDGRIANTPTDQATDVHAIITALGAGPVEMLASSGGAVTALALVAAHPGDVTTLVAHEPPLIAVLPDAQAARRAQAGFRDTYAAKGWGAGMAAFIAMTSWPGEFTEDYFAQPAPDPAAFGMPTEDDGSRDDPLLSDRSWAITSYQPDVEALAAAPTRIVIAVGEESQGTFTGRTAVATAALLGQQATVFPSHHGGFMDGEFGYAGQPDAFAKKLREVLDNAG